MSPRTLRGVSAGLVALLVVTEVVVRSAGLVDFPIYQVDDHVGYLPQPNQAGTLMHARHWVFNDRSMGIATPWKASDKTDILLIGNSVVLGGTPYDQIDKIAPLMQSRLAAACAVWPVATGGWSAVNALNFLERNPDLVDGTDFFVWEYMAHGLTRPTPWLGETKFPTRTPLWAGGYVVHKWFVEWLAAPPPQGLATAATVADNYRRFDAMLARLSRADQPAGIVLLYPDRNQLAGARLGLEWMPERPRIERMAHEHGLLVVDVSSQPEWTDALYRDDVHPTREGNVVLAGILVRAVRLALGGGC